MAYKRFIDAATAAARSIAAGGLPVKVVRDLGGWKVTLNASPRGPWERLWAAVKPDTKSSDFLGWIEDLSGSGNHTARAACEELRAALGSGIDTEAAFFNRAESHYFTAYPGNDDPDALPPH